MPRPVTRPQIWTALKDEGLVPVDVKPTRDIGRWVAGELWHAVCVHKSHDELSAQVWVGVAAFLEGLKGCGRMGVDVRIGEDWVPWPADADDVQQLLATRYAPALAAVTSPYDILDALEAGVLQRDGMSIGRLAASRPSNIVLAVILADYLGEPQRAEANRAAARQLKGIPQKFPNGTSADQWTLAQSWARTYSRSMGRPVHL